MLLFTLSVVPKHNRYINFIYFIRIHKEKKLQLPYGWWYFNYLMWIQNVKAVFDAAIKVVLQPPKNKKKKKRKAQKACSILWFFKTRVLWRKRDQFIIYPKSYVLCFPRLFLPHGRSSGLWSQLTQLDGYVEASYYVFLALGCVSTCILLIYILYANVQLFFSLGLVPYDVSPRLQKFSFYEKAKLVRLVSCFIIKRWFSITS